MHGGPAPGTGAAFGKVVEVRKQKSSPSRPDTRHLFTLICDEMDMLLSRMVSRDQYGPIREHLETEKQRLVDLYYGRPWPIRSD